MNTKKIKMMNFLKDRMKRKSPGVIAGRIIFGIIAITGLAILFGFIIMWLWNILMPEIFGLPLISYWQAVGLFILTKILFGSGRRGRKKYYSKYSSRKHSKHRLKSFFGNDCKSDFSNWQHYDKFWKEEGEQAYKTFVKRLDEEEINQTKEA